MAPWETPLRYRLPSGNLGSPAAFANSRLIAPIKLQTLKVSGLRIGPLGSDFILLAAENDLFIIRMIFVFTPSRGQQYHLPFNDLHRRVPADALLDCLQ